MEMIHLENIYIKSINDDDDDVIQGAYVTDLHIKSTIWVLEIRYIIHQNTLCSLTSIIWHSHIK